VQNPILQTKRPSSTPFCKQRRLSSSVISNTTLNSTIDGKQICQEAKCWGTMAPLTPYGYTPVG